MYEAVASPRKYPWDSVLIGDGDRDAVSTAAQRNSMWGEIKKMQWWWWWSSDCVPCARTPPFIPACSLLTPGCASKVIGRQRVGYSVCTPLYVVHLNLFREKKAGKKIVEK